MPTWLRMNLKPQSGNASADQTHEASKNSEQLGTALRSAKRDTSCWLLMLNNCVFDKVVVNENSQTQLLCNFMRRDDEFRTKVLTLFLPEAVASKVRPHEIRREVSLLEGGRPDITIEAQGVCALIEVKASTRCELRENQDIRNELGSYVAFLKRSNAVCKRFAFLVPRDWESRDGLNSRMRGARAQLADIEPKMVYWDQILAITEKLQSRDVLFEEYRRFLAQKFGPIGFNKEEIQMLSSTAFLVPFFKLTDLIKQIENKCKKEFKTDFENSRDEFAFYIKARGNPESLLYFGVWKDFAEQGGSPICYGVLDSWKSARTFSMICERNKRIVKKFGNSNEWMLVSVDPKVLDVENAAETIWEELHPILKELAMNPEETPMPTPISA